jgi:hypothetical protein
MENVYYFNYLGSLIKVIQDAGVKLNPGLSQQRGHSTRRRLSPQANVTYI